MMSAGSSENGWADDGYYSDDPVIEPQSKPRKFNKIIGAVAVIVAGVFFFNSTFAANASERTKNGLTK